MDINEMLAIILERTEVIMEKVTEQDAEIKTLHEDVSEIKLILEDDIKPTINQMLEEVEDIKLEMDILKAVMAKQSKDICKLKE